MPEDYEPYSEEDIEDDREIQTGQPRLPGIDDPKLWQVRVKRNFEKIAVMALLNKCIDFA